MPDARVLARPLPPTAPTPRAEGADGALVLSVLGPVHAQAGGRTLRLRSRKAKALLGYLALCDKAEETRERLVGLLWSESGEEKARASLRQVVHELREAMEEAGCGRGLRAERLCVALEPARLSLDLADVLREAEAGRVHPLLLDSPRLAEALLEGLDDVDPAFRVWLLARRQAFHDRLLRLLEPRLREEGAAPEDRRRRRRVAEAILRLDPTHEEACRALMAACAAEGDVAAALRAYESLWTLLGDEYDMEPSAATQELVAAIKSGRFEAEAVAAPAPVSSAAPGGQAAAAAGAEMPLRIALLLEPFAVNGVPPEQVHLVHGFRHDLIARLVRFREWFVVDGPALPPPDQTRARVGARYRIGATAYQAGARISVVLTLAEQDSGIFVWSERLDLTLEGWFEAQQRVVRRIAVALNTHITSLRLGRITAEPEVPLDGYDTWLRCRHMGLSFGTAGAAQLDRVFALNEELATRAPDFAPAFYNLAQLDTLSHILRPGVWRDRSRERRSLENAQRAVRLDPADFRAQMTLGWSLAMMGRYGQADTHMRLALELNSDDAMLLTAVALFRAFTGDHGSARALGQDALLATLVPSRTHWGYEGTSAYLRGEDEEALGALERAEDVILTLPAWRAAALYRLGRRREAAAAADRFLEVVARVWHGDATPTPEAMARWLLHQYPMRRRAEWERLRDGVAGAGLPVAGAEHDAWYPADNPAEAPA